ncbi:MAG: hypothetical protein SVZ03_11940 [Spirochaetota bacterium]|nr:hypothetical protein [Spirochaetota bacterium]
MPTKDKMMIPSVKAIHVGAPFLLVSLLLVSGELLFDIQWERTIINYLILGDAKSFELFSALFGAAWITVGIYRFWNYRRFLELQNKLPEKICFELFYETQNNPWLPQVLVGFICMILFLYIISGNLYPLLEVSYSVESFIDNLREEVQYLPEYILILSWFGGCIYGIYLILKGLKNRSSHLKKTAEILDMND